VLQPIAAARVLISDALIVSSSFLALGKFARDYKPFIEV
jgi:hypothetical protein